jgi:hypothetical protein
MYTARAHLQFIIMLSRFLLHLCKLIIAVERTGFLRHSQLETVESCIFCKAKEKETLLALKIIIFSAFIACTIPNSPFADLTVFRRHTMENYVIHIARFEAKTLLFDIFLFSSSASSSWRASCEH